MAPVAKALFASMAEPATVERLLYRYCLRLALDDHVHRDQVAAIPVTDYFLSEPFEQLPMMKTHVFGVINTF